MGSYKWGYKSTNMGYNYSCPNYKPHLQLPLNPIHYNPIPYTLNPEPYKALKGTPLITTHETPSSSRESPGGGLRAQGVTGLI